MESSVHEATELQSSTRTAPTMDTATLKKETTSRADLPQLVAQGRAAYEHKRTKECLELARQVLHSDPENAEAKALQAAVSTDIQRDLTDARALLDDAQRMDDGHKYRKAAEIILLKILYLDPSHIDAKALLAAARASTRRSSVDEIGFTAQPEPVEAKPKVRPRSFSLKLPLIAAGIALLAGGLWFFKSQARVRAGEPEPVAPAATIAEPAIGTIAAPATLALTVEVPPAPATTDLKPVSSTVPVPPIPVSEQVAPVVNNPVKTLPGREPGSLAVNSPTAADIYLADKLLGSTPTTLQLTPGRYTLEYRHGDLRTVMTHEIKSRETISALVTFDTTVTLNARPWAQVFVEGSARRALGQTPLSSVRVPIGSVLTFENPNFPPKSHRVVETDTAIQMVFP
jgi:hypothetical protein